MSISNDREFLEISVDDVRQVLHEIGVPVFPVALYQTGREVDPEEEEHADRLYAFMRLFIEGNHTQGPPCDYGELTLTLSPSPWLFSTGRDVLHLQLSSPHDCELEADKPQRPEFFHRTVEADSRPQLMAALRELLKHVEEHWKAKHK